MAKKKHLETEQESADRLAQAVAAGEFGAPVPGPATDFAGVDLPPAEPGAAYDATMAAVANGIEGAKTARKPPVRNPDAPRAVFFVTGEDPVTREIVVLSQQKTLRRAMKWQQEQGALIRRLYNMVTIYRAKRIV